MGIWIKQSYFLLLFVILLLGLYLGLIFVLPNEACLMEPWILYYLVSEILFSLLCPMQLGAHMHA